MKNKETTMQSTTSTSVAADSSQAKLRVDLNNLLREHVSSSLIVTRNIADGASEQKLAGAKAAQTANAVAIATAVGSIYSKDAQDAITTPFVEHIVQSNNYAQAVKDGNMAAQESSLAALRVELRKVANVFNSVIPSLSSDTLYAALSAHEDLLNQAAVEYQNGNFEKAYALENEALVQISGGADALTTGIIASKPDMFKN
jgi:mannose-1-phosphate guanylyltransferase